MTKFNNAVSKLQFGQRVMVSETEQYNGGHAFPHHQPTTVTKRKHHFTVSMSTAAIARRRRQTLDMLSKRPMRLAEVSRAFGMANSTSANGILSKLVAEGLAVKQGFYFSNPERNTLAVEEMPLSPMQEVSKTKPALSSNNTKFSQLVEEVARDYAWEAQGSEVSLKGFVAYVKARRA